MQVAFLLVIVAASAWVGFDASKRDWTDNSFARNTASWVVGCLLLSVIVFPLYLLVARKNAPLLHQPSPKPKPDRTPAPESKPAMALAAAGPSEAAGPSLADIAEPVVEVEPEAEVEPVVFLDPEPIVEAEPVVILEREPVIEAEPFVDADPLPAVPSLDWAALAAEDVNSAPEEPDAPAEEPGTPPEEAGVLSLEAFKDIKPVSFGGLAQEPVVEPEPEPVAFVEPEPPASPEPVVRPQTESKKRRPKLNLELKLPKLPSLRKGNVSLPPQLQGPLTSLEQKIVIGAVVCVAAAGIIGYKSAPETAAAPAAPPVPAAPATAP